MTAPKVIAVADAIRFGMTSLNLTCRCHMTSAWKSARMFALIAVFLSALSFVSAGERDEGGNNMGVAILLAFNDEELTVWLND